MFLTASAARWREVRNLVGATYDLCNEIRNFVFEYADSHDYTFYDLREQHGLLRNMMIRNSNTGEWMLVFQFHYDEEGDEQRALELMQQVTDKFPQITSLMYVDNQKGNDTINDLELSLFKGNDHIYELMEDLKFKVATFFPCDKISFCRFSNLS